MYADSPIRSRIRSTGIRPALAIILIFGAVTTTSLAGINQYSIPYHEPYWEDTYSMGNDLLIVEWFSFSLLTRTEEGFAETWSSDSLEFTLKEIDRDWITVEGNRVYLTYLDESDRAAGIVLEKQGDKLVQVGSMDMSTIRGEGPYDLLYLKKLLVKEGDVFSFCTGYIGNNPKCVVFSEKDSVWETSGFIDFGPMDRHVFCEPVAVTGSGEDKSFFVAREWVSSNNGSNYEYSMDRYTRTPEGWQVEQTIPVTLADSTWEFSVVVEPGQSSFLILNGLPRKAHEIQEFSLVDGVWQFSGYLELPTTLDIEGDVWKPYISRFGYFAIPQEYGSRFLLVQFQDGQWNVTHENRRPTWENRGISNTYHLGEKEIIAFSPLKEDGQTTDFGCALYSATDLHPLARPWFNHSISVGNGIEWIPNFGYAFVNMTTDDKETWFYSYELGWLYSTSRNGANLEAWSANLQTWIHLNEDIYSEANNEHLLYAYMPGDYLWHLPQSTSPGEYFCFKRTDWITDFNVRHYLYSPHAVADLLEQWDWEILDTDDDVSRVTVTADYLHDWLIEIVAVLENQYFTLKYYGDWNIIRRADGYSSEAEITIDIYQFELINIDGIARLTPEQAWNQFQLPVPVQFQLQVQFKTLTTGTTTGTVIMNSGESEPMAPFTFKNEYPPEIGE